jgi:hypothetical protein
MSPQEWLAALEAELPGDAVELGAEERDALLDLARIAAHTSERWLAPLTTFRVGLALAGSPPAERLAAIRRIAAALEPEDGEQDGGGTAPGGGSDAQR